MDTPDFIYNWNISFLQDRRHVTRFWVATRAWPLSRPVLYRVRGSDQRSTISAPPTFIRLTQQTEWLNLLMTLIYQSARPSGTPSSLNMIMSRTGLKKTTTFDLMLEKLGK